MQAFEEVMRSFLYRKAEGEEFSIDMLLKKTMEGYPDLCTKFRASKRTGNIKDLFVIFKDRVRECKR